MNWIMWAQAAAAVYLVGGALVINATGGIWSSVIFKVVPMRIVLPLAFGVTARLLGWPER